MAGGGEAVSAFLGLEGFGNASGGFPQAFCGAIGGSSTTRASLRQRLTQSEKGTEGMHGNAPACSALYGTRLRSVARRAESRGLPAEHDALAVGSPLVTGEAARASNHPVAGDQVGDRVGGDGAANCTG